MLEERREETKSELGLKIVKGSEMPQNVPYRF